MRFILDYFWVIWKADVNLQEEGCFYFIFYKYYESYFYSVSCDSNDQMTAKQKQTINSTLVLQVYECVDENTPCVSSMHVF